MARPGLASSTPAAACLVPSVEGGWGGETAYGSQQGLRRLIVSGGLAGWGGGHRCPSWSLCSHLRCPLCFSPLPLSYFMSGSLLFISLSLAGIGICLFLPGSLSYRQFCSISVSQSHPPLASVTQTYCLSLGVLTSACLSSPRLPPEQYFSNHRSQHFEINLVKSI